MSELQLYLLAIGALIIIAVLAFNWWQERKFHREVERSFFPLKHDALLDEPKMDAEGLDAQQRATSIPEAAGEQLISPFLVDDKRPGNRANTANLPNLSDFSDVKQVQLNNELAVKSAPVIEQSDNATFSEQQVDSKEAYNPSLSKTLKQEPQFELNLLPETAATISREEPTVQEPVQQTVAHLPSMLESHIDLTAIIHLPTETAASLLSSACNILMDGFDKPIYVHVLDNMQEWHLLHVFVAHEELMHRKICKTACSIQLADRGGALSRSTLSRFQLTVETVASDIGGQIEWLGLSDAIKSAEALDGFCIEVDKSISIHLMHGEHGPFTGTKLRGLAESQGLVLDSNGSFKYFDETDSNNLHLKPAFKIFNRDDYPFNHEMLRSSVIKGITFQIDIPHVKQCLETFNHMVQVAKQLEVGLNAKLVDDNNLQLGDMQIDKIRQQLKTIQSTMLMRGIATGSETANRLFS